MNESHAVPGRLRPGMKPELKVALCSSLSKVGDKTVNLEKFLGQVKEAAAQGADIVAFPETSLSGYRLSEMGAPSAIYDIAETIPGPSVERLVAGAREHHIYIVMGMYEADSDYVGLFYNTAVLVGPEGLLGRYRKNSIEDFGPFEMGRWGITPGDEIPVWEIESGWRVTINICYDLWVPEVPRVAVLKGADLIIGISAGPSEYAEGWGLVNTVRAIENATGLAYCNLAGVEHGTHFFGGRMAIEATGEVILPMEGSEDTEGMSVVTFTAENLRLGRMGQPQLRDRNIAAFAVLTDPRRKVLDFIPYRGRK